MGCRIVCNKTICRKSRSPARTWKASGVATTRNIEPIIQESTPAIIARKLRHAIGSGDLKPGEQLIEAELAKQLGVSRGPLREAMQRLNQEGLLTSIRNRGLFVAELQMADIEDMYLARTAVERAAGLKIIELEHTNAAVAAELLDVVAAMEELVRSGDAGGPALSELDIEFHETLVRLAGSHRLSRMHMTLLTETRMFLAALEGTSYSPEDRAAEHRAIAESIQRADVPLFHRLLASHMDDAVAQISASMAA